MAQQQLLNSRLHCRIFVVHHRCLKPSHCFLFFLLNDRPWWRVASAICNVHAFRQKVVFALQRRIRKDVRIEGSPGESMTNDWSQGADPCDQHEFLLLFFGFLPKKTTCRLSSKDLSIFFDQSVEVHVQYVHYLPCWFLYFENLPCRLGLHKQYPSVSRAMLPPTGRLG